MGVVPWEFTEKQLNMGKGQNDGFSEEQLQMYKDCFKLMDINKDGVLDKNDLRGAFDNVGVLMTEGELDGLLGEISGPCTYDNMVKMFQEKMAGEGNDPDDLIVQAFKAYDNEGKIDSKMFEHALKTWGDKMTKAEVEEPAPVEEAPEAEPEEDADAKKKKKKKKKAAKQISSFLYFSTKTLADPDKPANFEDSTFQTRYGQYGGGNHPNNIVAWYLTSTNISFIMNSQFTNKYILLWGME